MKKKKSSIIIPAILISSLLGGCGQKTDEALLSDMSVAVQTKPLEIGSLKVENSYIGTVMDVDAVNVVPLVNAEVVSVNVEVGDMVQEGDILCKLDDTDAQFNLLSAQTNYSNAQVSYKNAQASHEKAVAAYNTQAAVYNDTIASIDSKLGASYQISEYNDSVNLYNLRKQLDRYQQDLDDYREDYNEQSDEADSLEKKKKKAKKEMEAAKKEYESLLNKKTGLEEKINALEGSIQAEMQKQSESDNQTSDKEAPEGKTTDKETADNEISDKETIDGEASDNETPDAAQEADNADAEHNTSNTSAALDGLNAEAEETKSELQTTEQEIEAAKQKYEAAKAKYESLKAQSASADDTLEKMEETLDDMWQTHNDKADALKQEEYRQSISHGLGEAEKQLDVDTDKALALANLNTALINMETSQIGIDSAQLGIDSAQISIDTAKHKLDLYTLTAPVSGIVEQVNVTANNMGSSNQAGFVITNPDSKTVVFYVQDDVRKGLKIGQKVEISCNDDEYGGAISEIGVAVDSRTGMFQVKAGIKNGREIANGTQVELVTAAHEQNDAVVIPLDAVYFEDGVPYVYLYENDTAVKTGIDIILHDTENLVVGNTELTGRELITSWSSNLKDGVKVHRTKTEEEE